MSARYFKPVGLLLCGALLGGKPAESQEQRVWFWFTSCGHQALVLHVTLDGKSLYSATIPICQATRQEQTTSKNVSFTFQPVRAITWTGYRDDAPTTAAGQKLGVDLWQAGADPSDLVVGISVSDDRVVYMNATHVAYPEKLNTTEIETGLVVSTHPTDTTGWVQVPGMLIRPECVHHVPNGATVRADGDVVANGAVIAHYDNCPEPGIPTRPMPP